MALSFLTMVIAMSVKNDLVSIILVGGCMLTATAILYRNLSLFTSIKSDDGRAGIGLRLPWTVQDEDTWNIAHRILGYISIPVVLLYIACTCTIQDFKAVSVAIMITWIGIPGGISYVHFHKKYHGK